MPLPAHYAAGTIAVTSGGVFVTGSGTNWLTAGIRQGDVFAAIGLTVSIASVESATALTLREPWPGTNLNNKGYEIRYAQDAGRVLVAATRILGAIEGGAVTQNNYTADRPPTANDDIDDGYTLGSRWLFQGNEWVATSTTPGNAIWLPTSGNALIPGGDNAMLIWYEEAKT